MSLIDERKYVKMLDQLDGIDSDITYLWTTRGPVMGETGKSVVKILNKLSVAMHRLLMEMGPASRLNSPVSDDHTYPVAMPTPLYQAPGRPGEVDMPLIWPEKDDLQGYPSDNPARRIYAAGLGHMILERD